MRQHSQDPGPLMSRMHASVRAWQASNVLFGWWSHDIGGNHNGGYSGYEPKQHRPKPGPYPGDEDPKNHTGSEMLLRWIQFGVFSPILRTHCEPA